MVNLPGRVASRVGTPWNAVFVQQRFDAGTKTLLGTTGALDMDGALDVVLDHPSTAEFVAAKLYRELVGLRPEDKTLKRLAKTFRRDYAIMPLVESIARDDAFTSDAAVRAKFRSPVEKVVAIVQASGTQALKLRAPRRHRDRAARHRAAHDERAAVPPTERRRVPEGRPAGRAPATSCTPSTSCRRSAPRRPCNRPSTHSSRASVCST